MDLVVLAGGKSRRMGKTPARAARDIRAQLGLNANHIQAENEGKAFFNFEGESLIERLLGRIKNIFEKVIISSDTGHSFPHVDATEVTDIYPGCGSLGGLYTGLKTISSSKAFVIACDMPFVNPELVKLLIKRSEHFDVVVPAIIQSCSSNMEAKNMMFEPLHAVYSKTCLDSIEELIAEKNFRIYDFFDKVKVDYVTPEEIKRIDPDMISFFNINTPDDLKKAYKIIKLRTTEL